MSKEINIDKMTDKQKLFTASKLISSVMQNKKHPNNHPLIKSKLLDIRRKISSVKHLF